MDVLCICIFLSALNLVLSAMSNRTGLRTEDRETRVDVEVRSEDLDWTFWCRYQPNGRHCFDSEYAPTSRFYYDIKMEDCRSHDIGNCKHNNNQFSNLQECQYTCRDKGNLPFTHVNVSESIYCRLQPDFGNCNGYFPMWYYDVTKRTCKGFSYSGCGGNDNRFENAQICIALCGILFV